ncbi:MAG: hypothetical protein R6V75_04025 [Bacteroidales bacterium]
MRKLFAILLAVCLTAPFYSGFFLLHWQKRLIQSEVKKQMIRGLDKDDLVLMKFSRAESATTLRWEHPGEFEYRGEMYDVVETIAEGDSVAYWCWHDHRETRLNLRLRAMVERAREENPVSRETQKRLLDFYKIQFLPAFAARTFAAEAGTEARYPEQVMRRADFFHPPPVPPPWNG